MKKLAVIAIALLLFGCASNGMKMEHHKNDMAKVDYPTLAKQAKESISRAKSVGGEWRDSAKILKKAAKAAKAGNMKKAKTLASKAKFQGDTGYEQAMEQKNAGPWLF